MLNGLEGERKEIAKQIKDIFNIDCYLSEEDKIASGQDIMQYFDKKIENSDIIIIIIGKNYGKLKYSGITATEQEFEAAIRKNERGEHIEILVFILDEELEEGNIKFVEKIIKSNKANKFLRGIKKEELIFSVIKSIGNFLTREIEHPETIIDDIIDETIDDWYENYNIIGRVGKILLIAIPERFRQNYIPLFNEKRAFIGNEPILIKFLSTCFMPISFNSKIFSEGFGLFEKHKIMVGSGMMLMPTFQKARNEAKIYHTGVIEIGLDLTEYGLTKDFIKTVLDTFFKVLKDVYSEYKIKDNIAISINIVNADELLFNKDNDYFTGESSVYRTKYSVDIEKINEKKDEIIEITANEIKNFFNEKK